MNFRKKKKTHIELNVIPLVDVVFVLLIFFMVTTNFNQVTQLNLQLPQVTNEYKSEVKDAVRLKITADGMYYINDMPVLNQDKRILMNAIVKVVGANRNLPFTVSGDGAAPHQAVVTALDAASELGFNQIRITAVKLG